MARTIGPAIPRSISGNLVAATSTPICRPNPRKTSHGSRKRTLLILSRLPPRSTPTATPARSRTKARSTGAEYRRFQWAGDTNDARSRPGRNWPIRVRRTADRRREGLERLPSGEPRVLVVPEIDRFLAESPAQVDLPSLTAPGEVDQPLLDVAHHDVSVYEPGQFVRRGPGRGEPPGGPGVTPVAACGRGHRCA